MQAGLQTKKEATLQSFMGCSSLVAAGTEAVIALAGLWQSKALVGVLKSSGTLLQWLVSSAEGA